MNTLHRFILIMCLVLVQGAPLRGQERPEWKQHPNNIKFNLSSGLIYRNALIFGYERTINARQTFSVFGGLQQFPSFSGLTIPGVELEKERKASGYNFGGDYRFYLASENKFKAPHGLYIGPYASFYTFSNDNSGHFTFEDGSSMDGQLNTRFNYLSIGGQLGYQFVFWKRMSVDLILFGPSLTHYSGKMDIQSNMSEDQMSEEMKKVLQSIADRYPVLGEAIKSGSANFKGNLDLWSAGFRYSVHVGLRF